MARIVKLGELLPEDITFELPGGAKFVAPGDPPLELILKIAELFERAENTDGDAGDELGLDILRELDAEVLGLLRMRDSSLSGSPFGVVGVQLFVAELLKQYNFGVEGADDSGDPPKRAATRKKSPRSSGSRSS